MTDRTPSVYLDHAATSAVRPAAVVRAVAEYLEEIGATPGRGGHRLAIAADRIAFRCRQGIARLLDIPGDSGRIAFMHNATHALNTALWGVLRPGDRVVVTVYDHNSVLRPAEALARERNVSVVTVPGDENGVLDDVALAAALDGAKLLVINGASNVLGTVPDIAGLTARAHAAGALVLLDAAQLAGHAPFSVARSRVDMLALTGHKGLLGPQGTGALWVHSSVDAEPLLSGGTGGDSLLPQMPAALPDRLEAGTLNGPGIAGLGAGLDLLIHEEVGRVHERLAALKATLRAGLLALDGVHVHSPAAPAGVPIVTITTDTIDPATMALRLDREHGVLARAGLHCAPGVHRLLGTAHTGALRFSLGLSNTEADISHALRAVAAVLGRERAA